MQPIYTQTIGAGGAASVAFNNIPQGFTDLLVQVSGRTSGSGTFVSANIVFNGNTNFLYSDLFNYASGTGAVGAKIINYAHTPATIYLNGAGTTSNTFSNSEMYIANYSKGNFKTILGNSTVETNAASGNLITQGTVSFRSNTPITSMTLTSNDGNFVQYSTFTIYGISNVFNTSTPIAPTIGSITDQAEFASVAFTPASNDRADLYALTTTPTTSTTYGQKSPIVGPATLGTSYAYQVAAVNSLGSSPSSLSSAVTIANSYASIATASGDGTATAVLFTNIPQNYKNLQIRYQARTIRSQTGEGWYIRFNTDTASNYYGHYTYATESAGGTSFGTNGAGTTADLPSIPGSLVAANMPGVGIVDINNYSATTQFKTVKSIGGFNNNGSTSYTYFNMYTWQNYSPVTTLQVLSNGGLVTGSRIELFGIS